jgi:hypothetical protein
MATIKELKAELKAKGIKGITGKKKAELMAMLNKHGGEKSPSTPKAACSCHDKKPKEKYVAKLPNMTKGGKKISEPVIDKQISVPKKVSASMQEELAKAGLRGGLKKKYKV